MVNTTALVSSEAVAAGKLVLSQAVPASARTGQGKTLWTGLKPSRAASSLAKLIYFLQVMILATPFFLEWQSCSLSSIPFSIQADQIVQHVIEVAEGLSQPNEADSLKDEHLAFLRAQGSLDSHCQTMLELASDRHYHASHQHNADQSLQDLARVLLAAQSTS
ncbi:hypothetical protein WJX74_001169 [Apatococcus lobatus]|uniref:Uncharacterized protein n=1 Tax=Apatococcus lobatus TaxID=904363 RepID=A0AAW1RPK7_9CHLO